MTFEDLIRIVREDYLDDVSNNPDQNDQDCRWKNSFINRALRRGEAVACSSDKGADLLFDSTTDGIASITLSTGVADYALSGKITRLETVIYDGKPLDQKTPSELLEEEGEEWRAETGEPTAYIVRGRSIRLFPIPTASENGAVISLEVYRLPLTAHDDSPEIPEEYHEHLCPYAAYLAYERRDVDTRDISKSQENLAKFQSVFGRPVSTSVRRKHLEQPKNSTFRVKAYRL